MSNDALDQRTTEYKEWLHAPADYLDPLRIMVIEEDIEEILLTNPNLILEASA